MPYTMRREYTHDASCKANHREVFLFSQWRFAKSSMGIFKSSRAKEQTMGVMSGKGLFALSALYWSL